MSYLIELICPPLLEPLPVRLNMLIISACDHSYSIFIYIYLFTWLHRVLVVARGILVPQPGIEPVPPALLQYSGLENSMGCIVHGVTESDTTERLSLSLALQGGFLPTGPLGTSLILV